MKISKNIQFLYMFVIVLMLSGCNFSSIENDLDSENLNGKVKSIFSANYDTPLIIRNGYFNDSIYSTYNEDGNITDFNEYNVKGDLESYTVYTYGEDGNLTEKNRYSSKGEVIQKEIITCNNQGDIIQSDAYDLDGKMDSYKSYKYTIKNYLARLSYYSPDGTLKSTIHYKYNNEGHLIERSTYDSEGDLMDKFEAICDQFGNIINEKRYSDLGNIVWNISFEYTYDEYDNWIEKIDNQDIFKNITFREIVYYTD